MTRQETLRVLSELLEQQPQAKLEVMLAWLEQDSDASSSDDAFERKLRADVEAGNFDQLIAQVIAEDNSGETIDLETPCRQDVLETL
jgi:hypothetical protein